MSPRQHAPQHALASHTKCSARPAISPVIMSSVSATVNIQTGALALLPPTIEIRRNHQQRSKSTNSPRFHASCTANPHNIHHTPPHHQTGMACSDSCTPLLPSTDMPGTSRIKKSQDHGSPFALFFFRCCMPTLEVTTCRTGTTATSPVYSVDQPRRGPLFSCERAQEITHMKCPTPLVQPRAVYQSSCHLSSSPGL